MSDERKLIAETTTKYDSTPERRAPLARPRIGDTSEKPKTRAWGEGEEEEVASLPVKTEISGDHGETSFSHVSPVKLEKTPSGGASPARSSDPSSPARSDTEFIKKKAFAVPAQVVRQQAGKSTDGSKRGGTEESSSRQSELSSMRSGTPGSDTKSYRERIRERVQAAKERALAAGTFKQRLPQPPPPKPKSPSGGSRSDEFDKEEDQIEEAMQRHKEVRSKWKVATASVHVANIQSGYEFFSKGWEAPVKAPPEETEEEAEPTQKGETSDEEKLLLVEVLGSRESDWMPLYNYHEPELTDWTKLKEKQVGLYFCPSTSPVPLEEKLEPETPPRFLEEEGLFVGKKTKVSWKTRNKLEQRIMAMGSERFWFGEDGEIKGITDPLEYTSFNIFIGDEVPPELQVEFVPARKIPPGALSASGDEVYLLEVEVSHIIFRHHPLFSREHCLGERLRALCATRDNPANRLGGRLQALRNSRDHLLKLYAVSGDDTHLARANKLRAEIKEVRTDWLLEKKRERERLTNILETWRDLKVIREKQGYTSSCYKLRIVTRDEDNHDWENQLKLYLEEVWEEAEEDYQNEMQEYQKKLEKWKKSKEKKEEGLSSEDDGVSQSEDELEEPVMPKKPKRSKIEASVRDELTACLRPPGEPVVEVQLLENAEISPTTDNAMEEERRKIMRQCQMSVVLQVNGKQVDKSTGSQFTDSFLSDINHRYSLKLQSQPTSLALQIIDVGQPNLFSRKTIAQIYIPVPGKVHAESADWCDYEFSCGERIGPFKHTGVGCGQLELSMNEGRTLYTSGLIAVKAGWSDPLPTILHQPKSNKVTKPRTNVQKLKEWVEQVQLDPNDPNNADLFDYLKAEDSKSSKKDTSLNIMEFCSEDELFNNPRLKLLMLRNSGQPEFRAMRHIPLNEREIPKDIFKLYEKRVGGRRKKLKSSSIDQERVWAKEFIEQIKEDVLKKNRLNLARTFTDMVHEEPVPDLGTLGQLTFMKWLQPKRPLRPKRKKRKKFPVKSLVGQQLEIIVNIGRAFEVPVRKDVEEKSGEQGFSVVPVRPFIEVVFQGERRRTNTAEGANPTWNQDLHIPIDNPHGDFNPIALQSLKESVHIHLYDEQLVDIIDDDRLRETNIHQRLEKHWLASLRIPFAALYSNSRIEGTFQMHSPPVLLGYERESKEFRDSTFLTVFLIVHPPLHPPSIIQEKLETSEEIYIEQHVDQWLYDVNKMFPNRHVPALVMDSSGKSVCVTRFFKALNPPELDPDMKTTPEMAARFVSLIPVIPGNLLYPGYLDIWLTADQLLGLGVCESCSGAALLCCYMKALDLQAWLIVGCGLSSGPAMYVLTKSQEGDLTVWDPTTGKSYPTSHPFSPLYRVYCLIDDSNCQASEVPENVESGQSLRRDIISFTALLKPQLSTAFELEPDDTPSSTSLVALNDLSLHAS